MPGIIFGLQHKSLYMWVCYSSFSQWYEFNTSFYYVLILCLSKASVQKEC